MANTANLLTSVTTDFNVTPYYDDYDLSKKYYKILFKPGYAVQARELTQLQSMLQSQVQRFGAHVFKEGSIVLPGAFEIRVNVDNKKGNPVEYVKIRDFDTLDNTIEIESFRNEVIRGLTNNVHAQVIDVLDGDGTLSNTKTLYVSYISASTSNNAIRKFASGETLFSTNTGTAIVTSDNPATDTGVASWFKIEEGVLFAKGHFIWFPTQSIVLSRYNPIPTCKVGFFLVEKIVQSTDDISLLDPALESSNYSAPGADRFQIDTILSVIPYDDSPEDFVTLFSIKDGVVQTKFEKSEYNILGDSLAERTNDESGDYVVRGMNIQVSEHDLVTTPVRNFGRYANGNNQLLIVSVDPGLAYVKGYAVNNLDIKNIEVEKPIDAFKNLSSQIIATTMGQYVRVNEFVGSWELDKSKQVDLYNAVAKRISNEGDTTGTRWSTGSQPGSKIGSAIVNTIEYVSGTPGYDAVYDIYLSDVRMLGTNSFSTVRSLYFDNASTADMGADILGANNSVANTRIFDVNKSPLLYYTGSDFTRTVRDNEDQPSTNYFFKRTEGIASSLAIGTTGILDLSIAAGPSNEVFPYGTSTLSDTDINQDIQLVFNKSFNIGPLWTSGMTTAVVQGYGNTYIKGIDTQFNKLNVGDKVEIEGYANTWYITAIRNDTEMFLSNNVSTSVTANSIFKAYKNGDLINMNGKGLDFGADRNISATSRRLIFDLEETLPASEVPIPVTVSYKIFTLNTPEAKKNLKPNRIVRIDCSSAAAGGVNGPWCLGFSDIYRIRRVIKTTSSFPSNLNTGENVTKFFSLDNGQRDTLYELGRLVKSPSYTLTSSDRLSIELDYFEPVYSGSGGFFNINSYNIQDNDALSSNTTIRTENIPFFTSPTNGTRYNLRNFIDFRPVKSITAADTVIPTDATTNPSNTSTYAFTTSMKFPVPSTEAIYDYSYYLPRIDIVVANKAGQFSVIKGQPEDFPVTPEATDNQMLVGIVNIAPYPSLSPAYANVLKRKDLACSAKKASNRRYTMRDIGVLDQRIKNLEYYTSLTLLEKEALNLKVLDEDGLDRFKNGIFIDTFRDTSLTAKGIDPDYRIVTDPIELSIRPLFSTESFMYDYLSGSGVRNHPNGVITLNYTEVEQFAQNRVTDVRNLERGTFFFEGNISLYPKEDIWIDTQRLPDEMISIEVDDALVEISINNDGQDAQIRKSLINQTWEQWKSTVTGYKLYRGQGASKTLVGTFSTEAAARAAATWTNTAGGTGATIETVFRDSRIRTDFFANESTDTAAGSTKLVSSEIIPYIRPQTITVECIGLKPYSKMNAFFDDVNVSRFCTPLTATQFTRAINKQSIPGLAAEGSNLIVNDDGTLYFNFRLPKDTFRTGDRRLIVIDGEQLADGALSEEDASTYAKSFFFASGTRQTVQRTSYSTEGYLLTQETAPEYRDRITTLEIPFTPPKSHCCFTADAKVLMADMSWKHIYDVVPGDLVIGDNGVINKVTIRKETVVGSRKMVKFKGFDFLTTDDHLFLTKKGFKTWDPEFVIKDEHTDNKKYLVGENRYTPISNDDEFKMYKNENESLVSKFVTYGDVEATYEPFNPEACVYDLTLDGNSTYIVEGFVVHNCCAAYTVLIRAPDDEEGIFCTGFDIFVGRKSRTRGLWFEVREVDNTGAITTTTIPGTVVNLKNSDIVESTNGRNNPTRVRFTAPVFLFNDKEYAFVVHTVSPNQFDVDPDTQVWISRLGEIDKNTGLKINDREGTGIYYQTTNNHKWDVIPDIDMTIKVHRASFIPGTYSFTIGNRSYEKFFLANVSQSIENTTGDYYKSGDTITLSSANGTIYLGNTLTGNVSTTTANGQVVVQVSTNKFIMSNTNYRIGEKVDVYNQTTGVYSGVSATVAAVANAAAKLTYIDENAREVYTEWDFSTGGFSNNDIIRRVTSDGDAYSARINNVSDYRYSSISFEPKTLDFVKTSIGYEMDSYNFNSVSPSGFVRIYPSETYYFPTEKVVYGKSNELTRISGNRSNRIRTTFSSSSTYVSPVLNLDTTQTLFIDNIINNTANGENSSSGGSAINKYISQNITLADGQDAEDINIYLTSYRPVGTDVKVYVKLLHREDGDTLKQVNWLELVKDADGEFVYSSSADRNNFREYIYKLPTSTLTGDNEEYQYTNSQGIQFRGFKYYAVKIVLLASNSAVVPRVADLRVLALQK